MGRTGIGIGNGNGNREGAMAERRIGGALIIPFMTVLLVILA